MNKNRKPKPSNDRVMAEDRRDVAPEDFTAAEHKAVDAMAAPLIRQAKANTNFKGRRNRDAWMRMNRPSKIEAIDAGAKKINAFFDKVIPEPVITPEDILEPFEDSLERAHELLDTVEDRAL